MNEKAMGYIIFFAVMVFMNQWFNKWILYKAYKSAGLTTEQILDYRASLRGSNNQPQKLTAWVLKSSPDPRKTRRLLSLYNLSMAPSIICLGVSVMGLFSRIFDTFLDYAWIAVLAITMLLTIFGRISSFRDR